jgi:hypothetical protein
MLRLLRHRVNAPVRLCFAMTLLKIRDGESEGAVYAWFDSLYNEAN